MPRPERLQTIDHAILEASVLFAPPVGSEIVGLQQIEQVPPAFTRRVSSVSSRFRACRTPSKNLVLLLVRYMCQDRISRR